MTPRFKARVSCTPANRFGQFQIQAPDRLPARRLEHAILPRNETDRLSDCKSCVRGASTSITFAELFAPSATSTRLAGPMPWTRLMTPCKGADSADTIAIS